jgi:hypothetical protein
VANAFVYLGKTRQGDTMHKFGLEKSTGGNTAALNMLGAAREKILSLEPEWRVHAFKETKDLRPFLQPTSSLRVLVLFASDGDTSHAVSVYENWIFDSGLPKALPLCQEALNFCCGDGVMCIGIVRGYEFKSNHSTKRKRVDIDATSGESESSPTDKMPRIQEKEQETDVDPLWLL